MTRFANPAVCAQKDRRMQSALAEQTAMGMLSARLAVFVVKDPGCCIHVT